ncbi:MAG: prepilin-type N-terminal cleavage/methylation domain-containing protein [Sulfitobacter sp.]
MKRPPNDAGMTLIELVVAMAIFALVAIMGLQSLTGTLRIRDRLVTLDDQNSEIALALAMLRNDLTSVMPLLFYPPDRGAPRSALHLTSGGSRFAMSIGGQPDITGQINSQIHRAQWRLDRGNAQLYRSVWTTLTPANQTVLQLETLVLEGVNAVNIRTYWEGQGWIDGVNNPLLDFANIGGDPNSDSSGGPPETYSDILPSGIEITMTTLAYGTLTMIESFQ